MIYFSLFTQVSTTSQGHRFWRNLNVRAVICHRFKIYVDGSVFLMHCSNYCFSLLLATWLFFFFLITRMTHNCCVYVMNCVHHYVIRLYVLYKTFFWLSHTIIIWWLGNGPITWYVKSQFLIFRWSTYLCFFFFYKTPSI